MDPIEWMSTAGAHYSPVRQLLINDMCIFFGEDRILPNIDAEEYADVDLAPRKQFDFIHIRYQSSGICDGPRIFRLAFE